MKQSQFYYLLRRGLFMGGGGVWAKYVNDFKARVIADGGTMESPSCLKTDVRFLVDNPEPVPVPAIDADYQAVLDRSTALGYTAPSASQQTIQNTLVTDLKAAGVWDKLDVFYCFATDGDSDFATLNWKAPSSFQTTKVNSPTFTSNEGYNGDGSTSYLTTNYDLATNGVNASANDFAVGFYEQSITFGAWGCIIGCDDGNKDILLASRFSSGDPYIRMNDGGFFRPTSTYQTGLNLSARSSSSNVNYYDTQQNQSSTTYTSGGTPNSVDIEILKFAGASSSADVKVSIAFVAADLSSEVSGLYSAINTYMTAL